MIKELTELEAGEAENVLTEVASRLLPHPGPDVETGRWNDSGMGRIWEAVERYIASGGTNARTKLFDYISDRLSSPYLSDEAIAGVRARLGSRGELPIHAYNIVYQENNMRALPFLGMRRSHLEDALVHPDRKQLLAPDAFGLSADRLPAMSLFCKFHQQGSEDAFTLIVHCIHEAEQLTVWQAWRIYDHDVGVRGFDVEPLALLKAFVGKYGLNFRLYDGGESFRFLLYKALPPLSISGAPKPLAERREPGTVFAQIFYKLSSLEVYEVLFAYAIFLNPYVADLAKHRVAVDASGESLGRLDKLRAHQAFYW